MSARWVPAGDGTLSGSVHVTLFGAEAERMRELAFVGPPLPWWLDDDRMLEPLFLELSWLDAVRARPPAEGITHVWPGEPGHDEATQRAIDRTEGFLAWVNRERSIIGVVGGPTGVLRHGYITREPMFSWSRTRR